MKVNLESLTCTRCKKVQEFHCRIVYSQGFKVCVDCKKETKKADDLAFDRDMSYR